ncbi:MAG: zf-TFIIB domain-containing protein [Candidatus Omnitrophica bacterium]|nr:zf-TFIIB domain-containing protein [Candidatus Omnitrophota bacterium]
MPERKIKNSTMREETFVRISQRSQNHPKRRDERGQGQDSKSSLEMKCPRCFRVLSAETFRDIHVMRCTVCRGLWLDAPKLDEMENTVFPGDQVKGTLVFKTDRSALLCPICLQFMNAFNYRDYDLRLDFCADHGYWLDKDEEARVLQLMKEEAKAWTTKHDTEEKWPEMLSKLKDPTLWKRLISMLH